jgi:phage terminase large subunit-like protein
VIPDALTDGPRFAAYCERYVRHTKGRWARRPLILEDWQRDFWWEALERDPVTGLRVWQEVGFGLPRKNGKSVQASAAGLYFLTADGEDEPEVYVAAAARNQAGIVLGQSRRMALQSPRLRRYVHVGAHLIDCPRNGGIMRALSADAALQHGLNPSANIIDELHAHKSSELYTALTGGTGAREQPFTLWITTSGDDEGSILDDLLSGSFERGPGETEERDDGFLRIYRDREAGQLIYWYGKPDGYDVDDPDVWRRANPASWLQDGKVLGKEYQRMSSRGALVEFRTYHLNERLRVSTPWMDLDDWRAVAGRATLAKTRRTYAAVRVSHDHRSAAIAVAQRDDATDRVRVRVETYPKTPIPDDDYLDIEEVESAIRRLRTRYPAKVVAHVRYKKDGKIYRRNRPGPEIVYHGAFMEGSRQRLERDGAVLVDVPSTSARLTPAAETLMRLVTAGEIEQDGGAELERQISGVTAKQDPRGWKVDWLSGRTVVAAQAVMLAVDRAVNAEKPVGKRVRAM